MMKLYKLDQSPPARASLMTLEALNLPVQIEDFNIVLTNPEAKEEAELLKRSSVFATPVLEDGECTVMDGFQILPYLGDKTDNSFYPKDEEKRSVVDDRMNFDTGILFVKLCSATYPVLEQGKSGPSDEDLADIEEAYTYLEEYLSQSKFLAGDDITIADIAALADITSLAIVKPLDAAKFPKTQAWIEEMEKQPYVQKYNTPGVELLAKIYKEKLGA